MLKKSMFTCCVLLFISLFVISAYADQSQQSEAALHRGIYLDAAVLGNLSTEGRIGPCLKSVLYFPPFAKNEFLWVKMGVGPVYSYTPKLIQDYGTDYHISSFLGGMTSFELEFSKVAAISFDIKAGNMNFSKKNWDDVNAFSLMAGLSMKNVLWKFIWLEYGIDIIKNTGYHYQEYNWAFSLGVSFRKFFSK